MAHIHNHNDHTSPAAPAHNPTENLKPDLKGVFIGVILGLYWGNGKENGNYYNIQG